MQVNRREHNTSPRATPHGLLVGVTEPEVTAGATEVAAGCLQGEALHWARSRDLHGNQQEHPKGKGKEVSKQATALHTELQGYRGDKHTQHRDS